MPIDYCSPNEIRTEIVTQLSTSDDPALAKLITWTSRTIDVMTNRRFYTSTAAEAKVFNNFPGGRGSGFARQYGLSGQYSFIPPFDIASTASLVLEIAQDTVTASSSQYTTIDSHDFVVMPRAPEDGWPFQWLELKDTTVGTYVSPSLSYSWFPYGYDVIRATGFWGWNATSVDSSNFPQEIRMVAVEMAVKAWRTRETGYSNTFGVSEIGVSTITRQLSPYARDIIDAYTRPVL